MARSISAIAVIFTVTVLLSCASAQSWKVINPTPSAAQVGTPACSTLWCFATGSYSNRPQLLKAPADNLDAWTEIPFPTTQFAEPGLLPGAVYSVVYSPATGFVLFPQSSGSPATDETPIFTSVDGSDNSWIGTPSNLKAMYITAGSAGVLGFDYYKNTLVSTTDGKTWVTSKSPVSQAAINSINWVNGYYFIAASTFDNDYKGLLFSSVDGRNWKIALNATNLFPSAYSFNIGNVAAAGSNFVATASVTVGDSFTAVINFDLQGRFSLNKVIADTTSQVTSLVACNGTLLLTTATQGTPVFYYLSPSVGYWLAYSSKTKFTSAIGCVNEYFIGGGSNGYIAWSSDASAWTSHEEGIAEAILHSSYNAATSRFVVATSSGVYASLSNQGPFKAISAWSAGSFWFGAVNSTPAGLPGYVNVDGNYDVSYTTDLQVWTGIGKLSQPTSRCFRSGIPSKAVAISGVTSTKDAFIFSAYCQFNFQQLTFLLRSNFSSPFSWTLLPVPAVPPYDYPVGKLASGRGIILAAAASDFGNTAIVRSVDGVQFQNIYSLAGTSCGVSFAGPSDTGFFYYICSTSAQSSPGTVLASSDGTTWRALGLLSSVTSVQYLQGSGTYAASGVGTLWTSPDGLTWTQSRNPINRVTPFDFLADSPANPGKIVAVASVDNTISVPV